MIRFLKRPSFFNYLLNLGIRGATVASKFCFTFFLGKEYSESMLGEYGLFSTTILLCYFVLSFSFESYGLRELLQRPSSEQSPYIKNLFLFYLLSFLVLSPLSVVLVQFDFVRGELIGYFLILLFLETFCQVCFALFTIIQRSTIANFILFFNQGIWILFVFILLLFTPAQFKTIESFLLVWIGGSTLAAGYAFYKLNAIYNITSSANFVDWKWIRSGLSVSFVFFCSTLAYKLIEFTDRYVIELIEGTAKLGVYVFYSQLANLINTVINVVVILTLYPKLIENSINKDMNAFLVIRRKMYFRILGIGIFLSLLEITLINHLLDVLGKTSFEQEIDTFFVLLLSNIAMNLSFVPHYCLYAIRRDTTLLYTTFVGSALSISLNFLLIPHFGITGAALATCLSFLSVWISKSFYLKRYLELDWK